MHQGHHRFSWGSVAELDQLAERMRSLPHTEYEQAIVDSIRNVAARNPYVGPNCMSILITPPQIRPLVRVTFFPHQTHTARFVGSHFVSPEYPAAYSPWIVGSGLVHRPSVFTGAGWTLHMGPFMVLLNGSHGGPGILGSMSSQRRPPRAGLQNKAG